MRKRTKNSQGTSFLMKMCWFEVFSMLRASDTEYENDQGQSRMGQESENVDQHQEITGIENCQPTNEDEILGYPSRIRRPPAEWYMTSSARSTIDRMNVTTNDEPTPKKAMATTYQEAAKWKFVINGERDSLNSARSWKPCDAP